MSTATTNYGLTKPAVNDPVDQDLWGGELNDDMDALDGLVKIAINWTPSSQTANFSVTAPTTGSTTTGSARIFYLCDATSGNITAALPAAAGCSGMVVAFKKTDASVNTVILDGNSSETIDGATTYTIDSRYNSVTIESNGTAWYVLCTNANLTSYITTAALTAALAAYATLASPALTGTPTAPTATAATSTTQIATTAFVNGTALTLAAGSTATTQSVGDNTTKVATTAFVLANGGLGTPLGVGSIIMASKTGGGVAVANTTAAANLTSQGFSSSGGFSSTGDTLAGTWKALQANGGGGSQATLWQRTA